MSKQTELLNLTDGLSVDSSGNVGIGTSSPTADLEISAASNPEISIASTAGATSNFLNFKATSHTQQIQTQLKTEDNGDFTADLAFLFKGTGTAGALSEKMRIDAAGRVTTPYQPAFKAGMNASAFSTGGGSAQIIYDTTHFDRGGHYNTSTGRYTIPVTGLYEFTHNISARATYSGAFEVKLFQNGVEKHRQFTFGAGSGHGATATAILSCTQGDYIDARGYWGTSGMSLSGDLDVTSASAGISTLSYFSGYLIG